jgi:hypothetical protein
MTYDLDDIPGFLRISAADRRAAWREWKGFPSRPAPAAGTESAVRAELEERRRAKTAGRIGKMLAIKAERDAFNAIPKSRRRWDPGQCRFVAEST